MNGPHTPGGPVAALPAEAGRRAFAYNVPWRAVGFSLLLAVAFACGGALVEFGHTGIPSIPLFLLGGLFAFGAALNLIRKVAYPRMLVMDDEAICLTCEFSKTRTKTIRFKDIVRVIESNVLRLPTLRLHAPTVSFGCLSLDVAFFEKFEHYLEVRTRILQKTGIGTPSDALATPGAGGWREMPEPLLDWQEPEDWARYRSHLVTSKPPGPRRRRAVWFFVRWFAILNIPWLVLHLLSLDDRASLCVSFSMVLITTTFFTWLHWTSVVHPIYSQRIKFRMTGVFRTNGKQHADYRYQDFLGWTIVERAFEERPLYILLLEGRHWTQSIALPDRETRDRVAQILSDKNVPAKPGLKPQWEPA